MHLSHRDWKAQIEGQLRIHGQFLGRPNGVVGFINEPFAAGIIYPAVLAAWTFGAFAFSSPQDAAWPPSALWLAIVVFIFGLACSVFYVWWLKNTSLLIQIALDEGDIDRALQLLKGTAKKDIHGYTYNNRYWYYGFGDIALQVARAAEEARPCKAIELYQQSAERLIVQRGRRNYQKAFKYLKKMRALYEKLGEGEEWTSYKTALLEQNSDLPA